MNAPAFGRFLLPGPTEVHPDVLQAMHRPMIAHRGPEMVDLLRRMEPGLQSLFRTERPVYVGASARDIRLEGSVEVR